MLVCLLSCGGSGLFCFFKQKTAYEMRISDWSADVCSSDLRRTPGIVPLRRHTYAENASWQNWGIEPDVRTLVNRDDLGALIESVTALKKRTDIVVMSCHWGILEHPSAIAEYQREAARALIDAGVDQIGRAHV